MRRIASALVALISIGVVLGVAALVLRLGSVDEDLALLIGAPYFGAFFAFLFVVFGGIFSRIYDRRIQHYMALVHFEHYLNGLLVQLDDNRYLAAGFIDIVGVPVVEGRARASTNQLEQFPVEIDQIRSLLNLDLINDLFAFMLDLRRLNQTVVAQMRVYQRALEFIVGRNPDLVSYQVNARPAVEGMQAIEVELRGLHNEGQELLAKVRVLGKERPALMRFLGFMQVNPYGRNFTAKWERELELLRAELAASGSSSERRIEERKRAIREPSRQQ